MPKRSIIEIDEEKCTGCGNCIPGCPEGALQVIDGKARLISDLFCDGLGACVGECPEDAMHVIEREAEPYQERTVMENIIKAGPNTVKAHLSHLKDHGEKGFYDEAVVVLKEKGMDVPVAWDDAGDGGGSDAAADTGASCAEGQADVAGAPMKCGCPGSMVRDFTGGAGSGHGSGPGGAHDSRAPKTTVGGPAQATARAESQLRQWPVQIHLVPPHAPYLQKADLVIAADCVPFAYANFHEDFLKDRILLIGCPKLDDANFYVEKFTTMFKENDIRSITVTRMEVPCCSGMTAVVQAAIKASGKTIPFAEQVISVRGEKL